MSSSQRMQTMYAIIGAVVLVAGSAITVENRYALDTELDATKKFVQFSFTELRIDAISDKLNGFLLIPEHLRTDFHRAEILRLQTTLAKLQARLEQEGS